ncbi:DUF4129 domain-containing protein [Microbacterium sp.]|uniref:DUF4129 domain-containing protein n=1 Tax=Microbacterium sp. TaxID=51671 RepID=UPI002811190C|nr:DUF4129 domain-containing protein [Microbacterium sp.]
MPADPAARERESSPEVGGASARRSRVLLSAVTAGLFLIMMIAASVQGTPRIEVPSFGSPERATQTSSPPPSPLPLPPSQPQDGRIWGTIILILLLIVAAAVVILLVVLAVRLVTAWWRARPPRRRIGDPVDVAGAEPAAAASAPSAPVIRRGIAAARAVVQGRADPADAIIAAWVGLEETASDSGIPRGTSETPSEFTVRILLRRPGIDAATHTLLGLYESVRFGSKKASEDDRAEAARALAEIEEGWR